VGTQIITINALDSVTGEVIDSSTTGVVPLEIPGRNYARTPASVRLDVPPPGFQKYFGRSVYRPFSDGPAQSNMLTAWVQCSTGEYCDNPRPPLRELLRLDFEASEEFGYPQRPYSEATIRVSGAYGILTILETGDVLEGVNLGVTLDNQIMNDLFGLNCLRDDCGFRLEIERVNSLGAGWNVRITPEPSAALLIGLGLFVLGASRDLLR